MPRAPRIDIPNLLQHVIVRGIEKRGTMKRSMMIMLVLGMYGTASAQNLVLYHRETGYLHYYDRDSVFYPTMNTVGGTPDKSIIDVWEIRKNPATGGVKRTEKRLNCSTRQIYTVREIENGVINYKLDSYKAHTIKAGSADSYLYTELCIRARYR